MTTLREKIANAIDETVESDGRGGSITSSVTVDAVITAVIEHATCEEAVKRFLLEQYGEPDEDDPPHSWAPDTFRIVGDSIRAAIEG